MNSETICCRLLLPEHTATGVIVFKWWQQRRSRLSVEDHHGRHCTEEMLIPLC